MRLDELLDEPIFLIWPISHVLREMTRQNAKGEGKLLILRGGSLASMSYSQTCNSGAKTLRRSLSRKKRKK